MATYNKHMENVNKHRDLIFAAEQYIWANPETGFKEWKTQAYLVEQLQKLGYELTFAGNITGFYTEIDTGIPGPTVMLISELDALKVATHPAADPETHAAHACGHHAQCAILLGVAAAFKEPGALDGMCGKIRLTWVPAEEIVDADWRNSLREQGILRFLSGKQEFIARGLFDGVDIAVNFHAQCCKPGTMLFAKGNNGFMVKNVTFTGRSAHAGSAPAKGINALYAANLALNAINALRETFRSKDEIRVHPIIVSGGVAVNAIPDKVLMENQVRAKTVEAVMRESRKINRAVAGAALAMGANAVFCDRPGYMPLHNHAGLQSVVVDAGAQCFGEENIRVTDIWSGGSTDVGDLSCMMPTVCAYVGGAAGGDHSAKYEIVDSEALCVGGARVMAVLAQMLLENGAEKAKKIIEDFVPVFTSKEEYCATMEQMTKDCEAVAYAEEEDTASVRF